MVGPVQDLPMGFGLALLQNPRAAAVFQSLPAEQREMVIQRTHQVSSKAGMRSLVARLADGELDHQIF